MKLRLFNLRLFRSIQTPSLLAIPHSFRIQNAADDVVANTWKVFDATAANEDDGVFLQIVPLAADVRSDLFTVRKADTCDLAESGVRLLGCHGRDLETHAALLGSTGRQTNPLHVERVPRVLEVRSFGPAMLGSSSVTD